jgi:hypothetical protein
MKTIRFLLDHAEAIDAGRTDRQRADQGRARLVGDTPKPMMHTDAE